MSEITIVEETCSVCGVVFGMAEHQKRQRLKDLKEFFCPNGHSVKYLPNQTPEAKEIATLNETIVRIRKEHEKLYDENYQQRRHIDCLENTAIKNWQRSNAALRGVITKMRNRK